MRFLSGSLLLLIMSSWVLAAPNYIDFKPIDEVVRTPVGSVKGGQKVLPIITWGGDIATIFANGDAATTTSTSILGKAGLSYRLQREDVFANQVKQYISGETPFLRGTMGMIASASDALAKDPRTKPVVFHQLTWSSGGDALVVKSGINSVADLKGKTIAVQAYGPHVDYLMRLLKDAGLSHNQVNISWLPDLTGTDDSPAAALYEANVDAAFVIIPDALALTSGGNVGTGAEDSVKGARILMSTKTASRVIADVYAVRSDYYQSNKAEVDALASSLTKAQAELKQLVSNRANNPGKYQKVMSESALLLLDAKEAVADAEGLYADCELVGAEGNVAFFEQPNNLRNFEKLSSEATTSLAAMGLLSSNTVKLGKTEMSYKMAAAGTALPERPKFDRNQVSAVVSEKQQMGTLADGELFSFEVFFKPNQNTFSVDHYQSDFERVTELASIYGGAIITVEGHSDPMGYLRGKKQGQVPVVLSRIKQSAKNLSMTRAQAVRDAIIGYASARHVSLDESQFEPIGHGISQPKTGICGQDPCPPKTENEWLSNMRVVFRLIQVEAESDVFMPL